MRFKERIAVVQLLPVVFAEHGRNNNKEGAWCIDTDETPP